MIKTTLMVWYVSFLYFLDQVGVTPKGLKMTAIIVAVATVSFLIGVGV